MDESAFSEFLRSEWREKKNGALVAYKRLSEFFKSLFPEIKLASEAEKDLLIREFAGSGSFSDTHIIVAKLNKHSDFTTEQIDAIIAAAVSNNQIYWIITDPDVKGFLKRVIEGREKQLATENLRSLLELLSTAEEEGELPF